MITVKGIKRCWQCGGKLVKQPKEFSQQIIINYKCDTCGKIHELMPRNRTI